MGTSGRLVNIKTCIICKHIRAYYYSLFLLYREELSAIQHRALEKPFLHHNPITLAPKSLQSIPAVCCGLIPTPSLVIMALVVEGTWNSSAANLRTAVKGALSGT